MLHFFTTLSSWRPSCKEHTRRQRPEGQDLGLWSGQRRLPGGLHEAITGPSKAGQVGESWDQPGGKVYHWEWRVRIPSTSIINPITRWQKITFLKPKVGSPGQHCRGQIQFIVRSALPRSNLLGLGRWLRLGEGSACEGFKTIDYKERRNWMDLWLGRLLIIIRFRGIRLGRSWLHNDRAKTWWFCIVCIGITVNINVIVLLLGTTMIFRGYYSSGTGLFCWLHSLTLPVSSWSALGLGLGMCFGSVFFIILWSIFSRSRIFGSIQALYNNMNYDVTE